jgi:hypothetical protein
MVDHWKPRRHSAASRCGLERQHRSGREADRCRSQGGRLRPRRPKILAVQFPKLGRSEHGWFLIVYFMENPIRMDDLGGSPMDRKPLYRDWP